MHTRKGSIVSAGEKCVFATPRAIDQVFGIRRASTSLRGRLYKVISLNKGIVGMVIGREICKRVRTRLGVDSEHRIRGFVRSVQDNGSDPLGGVASSCRCRGMRTRSRRVLSVVRSVLGQQKFLVRTR